MKRLSYWSMVAALAVFLAASVFLSWGDGQAPTFDDPFPLRRVVIPASRLQAELDRARPGVLAQLPREDFEALVQRAAQVSDALRNPPRLVKASYSADLAGLALVGGGQWTVLQSGPSAGILPLAGLNLALSRVKSAGGSDAVLGELDGKSTGLYVDKAGQQTFFFDWSLRGVAASGGLKFEFKVLACPVAALELRVPADHVVSVAKGAAMVSGPHDAEVPSKRIWRIQFTGSSHLEIVVSAAGDAGHAPPLILTQVQTTQQIMPRHVAVEFDVNFEALHATFRELSFELDPLLEPHEVTSRSADIKSWALARGTPSVLTIQFREAVHGSAHSLRVRCLGPQPADNEPWHCPWIRLRAGVARGETLQIQVHPDAYLENWNSGAFRHVSSTSDASGMQILNLVDAGAQGDPKRRPSARFRNSGFDLVARQNVTWRIKPDHMGLEVETTYRSMRGSLFHLSQRLPDSGQWRVEGVDVEPADFIRSWTTLGSVLRVELDKGLSPRSSVRLKVRLSRRMNEGFGSGTYGIPDVRPLEPAVRHGTLAIELDPVLGHSLVDSSVPPTMPEPDGPSKAAPAYYFAWHDEAPRGQVRIEPHKQKMDVRCLQEVVIASDRADWQATLELEPLSGNPSWVDVELSVPIRGQLEWSRKECTAEIQSVKRLEVQDALRELLVLGRGQPFEHAVFALSFPRSQRWRVYLQAPLQKKETIVLKARLAPNALGPMGAGAALLAWAPWTPFWNLSATWLALSRWDLPLVTVSDTVRFQAEVRILATDLGILHFPAQDLGSEVERGSGGISGKFPGRPARSFRFSRHADSLFPSGPIPGLTVWTSPLGMRHLTSESLPPVVFDRARLTTQVEIGHPQLQHFRFQVWNWSERDLPVKLPEGTRKVLAVRVGGHWHQHLVPHATKEGLWLHVPWVRSRTGVVCEILYTTEEYVPFLGGAVTAGPPRLPASPVTSRHTWRLGPGLTPLFRESWHKVSVASAPWDGARIWHGVDDALETVLPGLSRASLPAESQLLYEAEAAWRRSGNRDSALGPALDRFAREYLKNQLPMVVDRESFRAAGLTPRSPHGPPSLPEGDARSPWEIRGLAVIAFPGGTLITNATGRDYWRPGADNLLTEALNDAKTNGQDAQGRFVSLSHWLATENRQSTASGGNESHVAILGGSLPSGWTEWESTPESDVGHTMVLVVGHMLHGVGLFLAVLVVFAGWQMRHLFSSHWRLRSLLFVLAVLAVAFAWLPGPFSTVLAWPVAAIGVLIALWYFGNLVFESGRLPATPSTDKALKVAVGVSVLWALSFVDGPMPVAWTGGVEPSSVFLVDNGLGKQQAYVSPEVLKKLGELERRGPTGAVLLTAAYQGKVSGTRAEFVAQFQLFNFSERALLTLPLSGVDLKEGAFLDGAPVFPTASAGPKPGYQLAVEGKGAHTLSLAFSMRCTRVGVSQELRFSVPKLFQSRVEIQLAEAAQDFHLHSSIGEERTTVLGNSTEIKAHLGPDGQIAARWRPRGVTAAGSTLEVREAYYWDPRPGASSLSALMQFIPGKNTVDRVRVALPVELEVRTVEASSGAAGSAVSIAKNWRIVGGGEGRHVLIELTAPTNGLFTVSLGLVWRFEHVANTLLLRLPAPLDGKQTEGFLAYRLDTYEATDQAKNLGLTSLPAESFAKVWAAVGQRDLAVVTRAYSFRRSGPTPALALTILPTRPQASQEIVWKVDATYADFTLNLQILNPVEDLSLLRLAVPRNVTMADIRGPQVHHWSRHDGVIHIWLRQPRKQVALQLNGWTKLATPSTSAKPGRFQLPLLGIDSARVGSSTIKILPTPGVAVEIERTVALTRQSAPDGALHFVATDAKLEGEFRVRAHSVLPEASLLMSAESRGDSREVTCHVQMRATEANATSWVLHIRRFPAEHTRVEGMPPSVRSDYARKGDDHTWRITVPAGLPQPLLFRVRGQVTAGKSGNATMPVASVEGARIRDVYLALVGDELRAGKADGLELIPDPTKRISAWPDDSGRLRRVKALWRALGPDYHLLMDAASLALAPSVQALLYEHDLHYADGRWIHVARVYVWTQMDGGVHIALPSRTGLQAVAVDAELTRPVAVEPDRYWIPFSGVSGPRRLDICWVFSEGQEPLTRPSFAGPLLAGAAPIPVQIRVYAPPGMRLMPESGARQSSEQERLFSQGRALLEMSRLGAGQNASKQVTGLPVDALSMLQKHLYWLFRTAESAAEYVSNGPSQGASWSTSWKELLRENASLAKDQGWETLRAQAEKLAAPAWQVPEVFAMPETGLPHIWRSDDPARPSSGRVDKSSADSMFVAIRMSQTIALGLIALLIVSFLPRGIAFLVGTWPEQMFLFACLGTWCWGFSAIGLALGAVGMLGRAVWCMRVLGAVVGRAKAPTPSSGLGVS